MTRIRFPVGIHSQFVAMLLHQRWREGYFADICNNHVSQASVSRTALAEVSLPVPPQAEQCRIVASVETVLAKVSSARERLERVPTTMKRFRQAILTAACSGRITGDWRSSMQTQHTAAELLETMAIERQQVWAKRNPSRKYRPPEAVEEDELPEIPSSWYWTNFDHCASEITVGHVGPMKDRYVVKGVPFLRSQNVRPLRFSESGLVQIAPEFHDSLRKSALVGGEILITRSGANTGDCCVFPTTFGHANCADLVVTRPLSGLLAEYGAIYVTSPDGQERIGLRETGMAQPHFNIGAMRVKPFPLPPLAEQHEIVQRVSALFALADSFEQRAASALKRVESLAQAILARAFRGELVPTEAELARREKRTYETADELLARIRATPAAVAKPKRARKATG
jgi:type I restriction enzyme S subunit